MAHALESEIHKISLENSRHLERLAVYQKENSKNIAENTQNIKIIQQDISDIKGLQKEQQARWKKYEERNKKIWGLIMLVLSAITGKVMDLF